MGIGTVNLETLVVKLVMDASGYNSSFRGATATLTSFENTVGRIGRRLTTALTLPLAGLGVAATREFANFDNMMTKSVAIIGNVSKDLRAEMEQTAFAISSKSITAPAKLAEAYYELASAGMTAQQSIASIATLETFAVAGSMDLSEAVRYVSQSQGALGLNSEDAATHMENLVRITDVLTEAANRSQGTIESFSKSLSNRGGAALRLYNKSVEEGVAILAAYAKQGIVGERAGEYLNIALRDLQRTAIKNPAAFDKLGISVFDAAGNMHNMADIIHQLEDRFEGASSKQRKMALQFLGFQDRSLVAIQTLVGYSHEIQTMQNHLEHAAGATQKVADIMRSSFTAQLTIALNHIRMVGIEVGSLLAPWILKLNSYLQEGIQWWEGHTNAQKRFILATVMVAGALGPVLLIMKSVIAIGAFFLLTPIMLAWRFVTTLYAIIVGLYQVTAAVTIFSFRTVMGFTRATAAAAMFLYEIALLAGTSIIGATTASLAFVRVWALPMLAYGVAALNSLRTAIMFIGGIAAANLAPVWFHLTRIAYSFVLMYRLEGVIGLIAHFNFVLIETAKYAWAAVAALGALAIRGFVAVGVAVGGFVAANAVVIGIIAAITAAVAGLVYWLVGSKGLQHAWESVKVAGGGFSDWLHDKFGGVWDWIKEKASSFFGWLHDKFVGAKAEVQGIVGMFTKHTDPVQQELESRKGSYSALAGPLYGVRTGLEDLATTGKLSIPGRFDQSSDPLMRHFSGGGMFPMAGFGGAGSSIPNLDIFKDTGEQFGTGIVAKMDPIAKHLQNTIGGFVASITPGLQRISAINTLRPLADAPKGLDGIDLTKEKSVKPIDTSFKAVEKGSVEAFRQERSDGAKMQEVAKRSLKEHEGIHQGITRLVQHADKRGSAIPIQLAPANFGGH